MGVAVKFLGKGCHFFLSSIRILVWGFEENEENLCQENRSSIHDKLITMVHRSVVTTWLLNLVRNNGKEDGL